MQQLIDLHEGTGPAGPDVGGWLRVGGGEGEGGGWQDGTGPAGAEVGVAKG